MREQAEDLGQSQVACLKPHWSVSKVSLLILFALNLALASACTRGAGVDPGGDISGTPAPASLPPTWTSTPLPEASATPQPTSEPTSTVAPTKSVTSTTTPTTPSTEADSIALFLSYLASHSLGDNYYFHVLVLDKDAEFLPETIEVIDPVTNQVVAGPFVLDERFDSGFCDRFARPGDKFYETEGIDPSQLNDPPRLPPDFGRHIFVEPIWTYRVTVREPTGAQQLIDIFEPLGICQSEEIP